MVDFRFERVEKDDPRMKDLFRLRYQVYVTECGFESPEDHPDGLEYDKYDEYSSHFVAMIAETREIIGTVRIIMPSVIGLPIEEHCRFNPNRPQVDPAKVGEISRLAISKELRRREIDKAIYSQEDIDLTKINHRVLHEQRRDIDNRIVAGLYQCIYHESADNGLEHWYAVMVKGLCNLLQLWGISWVSIGPEVEYHGLRGPYLANIRENKEQATLFKPELLDKPLGWK